MTLRVETARVSDATGDPIDGDRAWWRRGKDLTISARKLVSLRTKEENTKLTRTQM